MTAPLSYIIPAYNCAGTIVETVQSILAGNLLDGDEIVIVDDGSTDGTAKVLAELADGYGSIRVVTHRRNRGGAAARNTAVENARNDLLFCLDSDNVLIPDSVSELRRFREEQNADVAAFRELHYFRGECTATTHRWRFREGAVSLADHLAGAVVPGASGNYLYTRGSWLKAGGYPEFAGALDAWGLGLRQVATGQRMMVMPGGAYRHRYGHESYWVRDSSKGRTSLIALQILIPFLDQLAEADIDYIMGRSGRLSWFGDMDRHPLRLADGRKGQAGVALDRDGNPIPVPSSFSAAGLRARLAALYRRVRG